MFKLSYFLLLILHTVNRKAYFCTSCPFWGRLAALGEQITT